MLHTLNALPGSAAARDCLAVLAAGDTLLLLGDGVYAAMEGAVTCELIVQGPAEVHVLAEDAAARGVCSRLAPAITPLDMAGFVALSERYPRQMAWY